MSKGIWKEYFPEWTHEKALKLNKEENTMIALFICHIARMENALEIGMRLTKANKKPNHEKC